MVKQNSNREVDLGTFVDQEEGDIDDESDVELDLDLDSEHNDDDLESDSLLSDSVDRAGSAEEFQWSLTLPEQVLKKNKLDNTNLLHSLPPARLFKLFIMMILLLKWLSRPSMLFKEAHHDHSGQYLMGS